MLLKELKTWINNLPEKFDEYSVVNGEYGELDGEFFYRLDKPVTVLTVDEEHKEIIVLNDKSEDEKIEKNEIN